MRKDRKLYRLCKIERAEIVFACNKIKISIFDKPDYLFAAAIMSDRQCMNMWFYIFKNAKYNLSLQLVNCLDFQPTQFQLLEIKFNVLKFKRANNNW